MVEGMKYALGSGARQCHLVARSLDTWDIVQGVRRFADAFESPVFAFSQSIVRRLHFSTRDLIVH